MDKATPRPWVIDGGLTILGANNLPIAHSYSDYLESHEESRANAELIVKAVNEYDKLKAKEALFEEMVKYLELVEDATSCTRSIYLADDRELTDACRGLLAKAKATL